LVKKRRRHLCHRHMLFHRLIDKPQTDQISGQVNVKVRRASVRSTRINGRHPNDIFDCRDDIAIAKACTAESGYE